MPDFAPSVYVSSGTWTDISGGKTGTCCVQNQTGNEGRIWLGENAPTSKSDGMVIADNEAMNVSITSKLWAYSLRGGRFHVSEREESSEDTSPGPLI